MSVLSVLPRGYLGEISGPCLRCGGVELGGFAVCVAVCMLHTMNSADVIRMLKADGWEEVATRGSHHQFKHLTKPGRVTVPHPKKDLPAGTLHSILKQAGLK